MTDQSAGNATRRETLLYGAALTAAATIPSTAEAKMGQPDELATLDATATAAAIRAGKVSMLEVVDAAISRSEAMQPKLNFLVTDDYQRARDRAKAGKLTGPFAGVPFLIKDLHEYVGLPTRHGSRLHLKDGPATAQQPFSDALDRAGLNVIGSSASPEYGFMPTTEPLAFGPTRNPWNPDHSSGGSSGGAAVATASLVVPFAHASDGGGSIRMPATNCHVFGLKPSRGRTVSSGEYDTAIRIGAMHCNSRSRPRRKAARMGMARVRPARMAAHPGRAEARGFRPREAEGKLGAVPARRQSPRPSTSPPAAATPRTVMTFQRRRRISTAASAASTAARQSKLVQSGL